MHKHTFDRKYVRGVIEDDFTKLIENSAKTPAPVIAADANTTTGDIAAAGTIMVDNTKTGDPRTRINT
jgi:hypothetical protein